MKTLRPYLMFDGDCETALRFYAEALGGQIKSIQRYGDVPAQAPEADKARVMHAEFEAEGIAFMASDGMPGRGPNPGSMIWLTVLLESTADQDRIWDKLAQGGNVSQPLQETFWGARFGMVTDKFGIPWMLNCELGAKK